MARRDATTSRRRPRSPAAAPPPISPNADLGLERVEGRERRPPRFRSSSACSRTSRPNSESSRSTSRRSSAEGQGQVVVGLDDLHRLDEDGLARARAVVHDPGDAAPRGRLDRKAVAVVAQARRRRRRAPRAARRGASRGAARPRRGAGGGACRIVGELRRRVILEASVFGEELRGAPEQSDEGREALAVRGEDRAVGLGERPADRFRGARRAHDRTKILRRPRAAGAFERVERGADLVEAGQGKASVADLERGSPPPSRRGGRRRGIPRERGPETEPPPVRAAFEPERIRAGGRRRTRATRSRRRLRLPGLRRRATSPPRACGAFSCGPESSCASAWRSAFRSAAAS